MMQELKTSALRELRQAMLRALQAHYEHNAVTLIDDVPTLVPITGACENVATLYALTDNPGLYLTQTGQLALEVELQHQRDVYCIIASFRADNEDARHLNEFRLVEEEFAVAEPHGVPDPDAAMKTLLGRIQEAVSVMLRAAMDATGTEDLGARTERLVRALSCPAWPAITYRHAIEVLDSCGRVGAVAFGADLTAEYEAALVELVANEHDQEPGPVFVTHYPEEIKFFNMKVDPTDPTVVLSADLLLPDGGESVGAAVREYEPVRLRQRLANSRMLRQLKDVGNQSIHDFDGYLELMGSGTVPPHAGYGIGLERVLQFVLQESDIRKVSGPRRLKMALGAPTARRLGGAEPASQKALR